MTGILLGILAGAVGGAWHLCAVAWRARVVTRGRPALAVLATPLGLVGPGLAGAAVLFNAPELAWSVFIGLILARVALVRPLADLVAEEGPWTR